MSVLLANVVDVLYKGFDEIEPGMKNASTRCRPQFRGPLTRPPLCFSSLSPRAPAGCGNAAFSYHAAMKDKLQCHSLFWQQK
jgi:hypothetical protein